MPRHRQYTLELERVHGRGRVREDILPDEQTHHTHEHLLKLFMARFPILLHWARTDAGLSMRELARRAKIAPSYLSRVERSICPAPTWDKIIAIARQVPHSELARTAGQLGEGWWKNYALNSARELDKTISALSPGIFEDSQWRSEMQSRLQRCLTVLQSGNPGWTETCTTYIAPQVGPGLKRTRTRMPE